MTNRSASYEESAQLVADLIAGRFGPTGQVGHRLTVEEREIWQRRCPDIEAQAAKDVLNLVTEIRRILDHEHRRIDAVESAAHWLNSGLLAHLRCEFGLSQTEAIWAQERAQELREAEFA